MEQKIKGIIISTSDYGESDKLALCFSYELGIIHLKFRGVKKEKAKFKAVCQPFVFAEFVLASQKDYSVVTSCDIIENFSNILLDLEKSNCAFIIFDIIKSIIYKNNPEENLFIATLKALKSIEQSNQYDCVVLFILNFLNMQGVGLNVDLNGEIYLDLTTGNFTNDSSSGNVLLENEVYKNLLKLNLTKDKFLEVIKLLGNIIYIKFDVVLKSIKCYLSM